MSNPIQTYNLEQRRIALNELRNDLDANKRIISLKSIFKLTKTENSYSQVYLFRDLELENEVREYLKSKTSFEKLLLRYHLYDCNLKWSSWPKHYAVRILSGTGPIACGKNIFAFFPEALRILPRHHDEVFGIEFIDVWENIFEKIIFPCVRQVFDMETQLEVFQILERNLSRTIYLASVFHEIGHRCGPWRVSPTFRPGINLNPHHWGIVGEISTCQNIPDQIHYRTPFSLNEFRKYLNIKFSEEKKLNIEGAVS